MWMNDVYLYVAVTIATLFVVVKIGLIIASSRQPETRYALLFFLLCAASIGVLFVPAVTLFLAEYRFFIVFGENLPLFATILFFLSAITTIDSKPLVRTLYLFVGLLVITSLTQTLLFGFPLQTSQSNYPDEAGIMLQSTPYTSVATAAAILLNDVDIKASEQTMAELTFTRWGRGADILGTYHALKIATHNTPSRNAVFMKQFDIASLKASDVPVLIFVNLSFPVTHAVVVESFNDGMFTITDPLSGRYVRSALELESIWTNPIGIYIES